MPATTYRQLSDAEYSELRNKLLGDPGGDTQRSFLSSMNSNQAFCQWMNEQAGVVPGQQLPVYPSSLSEDEYIDPNRDIELSLYEIWREVPPAIACKPTFWGAITIAHIEAGSIDASYLACSGKPSSKSGRVRVDRALETGAAKKEMDRCVRTSIRQLSGLPERGARSVFVNCPFSRIWWRMRLCETISANLTVDRESILEVLRLSQQYWEELVSLMVSRNSLLGDESVRDVLVWSLAKHLKVAPQHAVFKSSGLNQLCRILGMRAAWQEMGVLTRTELGKVILDEIHQQA